MQRPGLHGAAELWIFPNAWKGGERGGARTHDPVIKSHVLYRLSYALPGAGLGHGGRVSKPKSRLSARCNRPIPQRFKHLRWFAAAIGAFVTENTLAGTGPA